MLHSEQNLTDLEKSLLIYYDDNSETSDPIIIIPKQYILNYTYKYVFVWLIIIILLFICLFFLVLYNIKVIR